MRKPMVTRTVTVTKCSVLRLNIELNECEVVEKELLRTYKNEEAMLKALNEQDTDGAYKYVAIKSYEVTTRRYGMSETEFIKQANLID